MHTEANKCLQTVLSRVTTASQQDRKKFMSSQEQALIATESCLVVWYLPGEEGRPAEYFPWLLSCLGGERSCLGGGLANKPAFNRS